VVLSAALGLLLLVQPAGVLRGRVDVQRSVGAAEPRPSVSDLGAPAAPAGQDRRRTVLYLDPAPQGAFEDLRGARARMDQRAETFVPYVLPVTLGTTVDFPNEDLTFHNVFSLSRPARFDLGRYGAGRSRAVRFDRPGVVRVFCDIHSHMSAYVLVFAHRFFAATDAEGRYRIEGIPPGTWTVQAWNDGAVRAQKTIEVPPQGGVVELDWELE
jgi:plastocyanin